MVQGPPQSNKTMKYTRETYTLINKRKEKEKNNIFGSINK
jgi:hypothetical protein